MKLYSYFRSSASFRVRIALALKNIAVELQPIHLLKQGGEHKLPSYADLNPQKLVPVLQLDDGTVIGQSLAIMEYLEECYPTPALLEGDAVHKAKIRAFCQAIACDIHPLNNLRVLAYLNQQLHVTAEQKTEWYQHWVTLGFEAIEAMLGDDTFCFGDTPSMADCCLIPQVYNAKRFDCDLTAFPKIVRIYEHCMSLPAFISASPEQQPDAN
ncbi:MULTISPECIES: maleylacetoacetate isomerase [unclassified Moraxella]|uniref:maleylacetoacetate isomerase n=1 Tax=unclassified Moraxella TaxID=2685852 RepID=UPI003AF883F5